MFIFAMNNPVSLKYLLLLLPLIYPISTCPTWNRTWSYDDKYLWGRQFRECNGTHQSPISLKELTVNSGSVPELEFVNYNELLSSFILENNGHTIQGLPSTTQSGNRPYITGALLNGIFEVENFHFHWGSPSSRGSEHSINGRRFDVELHIVHKNRKYFCLDEATMSPDGLAVLGIMIKAERDNYGNSKFDAYNEIFNEVPKLTEYQSSVAIEGTFDLDGLLGDLNPYEFYTYNGSLTTPPCSEAVIWHVFTEPIAIPYNQIRRFFNVQDNNGQPLLDNYRPLKNRNFRPVYLREQGFIGSILSNLPFIG